MLPNPHNLPSASGQSLIGIAIASSVGVDLVAPEFSIAFRPSAMLWATVPEAPIDEDSHFRPRENNVYTSMRKWRHHLVDAVSQAYCMEATSHPHLGGRVALASPRHPPPGRI